MTKIVILTIFGSYTWSNTKIIYVISLKYTKCYSSWVKIFYCFLPFHCSSWKNKIYLIYCALSINKLKWIENKSRLKWIETNWYWTSHRLNNPSQLNHSTNSATKKACHLMIHSHFSSTLLTLATTATKKRAPTPKPSSISESLSPVCCKLHVKSSSSTLRSKVGEQLTSLAVSLNSRSFLSSILWNSGQRLNAG